MKYRIDFGTTSGAVSTDHVLDTKDVEADNMTNALVRGAVMMTNQTHERLASNPANHPEHIDALMVNMENELTVISITEVV